MKQRYQQRQYKAGVNYLKNNFHTRYSLRLLNTVSGSISVIHLKCFFGHLRRPTCEQGRHLILLFSMIVLSALYGKKPSSLTVDPKMAKTGVLTAAAKCIKPESLLTTAFARLKMTALSRIFVNPAILITWSEKTSASRYSLSCGPPSRTILFELDVQIFLINSRYDSAGQLFVK